MVLAISALSLADDLNPPDWAGAPGTIYGIFGFPSADSGQIGDYPEEGGMTSHDTHPDPEEYTNSSDPDEVAHQYMMLNEGGGDSWLASHEGREGVLEVSGGINFGNYNFPGEGSKIIRLQLTYTGSEMEIFYFDAPPLDEWNGPASDYLIETIDLGDGWFHSTYDFPIEVNPGWEQFWVGDTPSTMYFDQIVIDTICYPGAEPPVGPGRGAQKPPVTVDTSSDMPVYEPADAGGPPPAGSPTGQLFVSLTWRPGEEVAPGYPNFIATVVIDPNEGTPHEDFIFSDSTDPNGTITLTFDETDYSVPQAVNVEALADLDREGNQRYPIELTVTIDIADPNFGNPTPVIVQSSVSVVDNDIPYISVLPVDPCSPLEGTLTENDPCVPVCFKVSISHLPTDDVYVLVTRETWEGDEEILLENMSVMDPPLDYLDPNKLTFTTGTGDAWVPGTMTSGWNMPQTICLEARDDDELLWEEYEWVEGWITLTPYSEDERYRVSWLTADGSEAPAIPDPCDPGGPGYPPDSGGEAEEVTVDFTVRDNECGSVGYPPYDVNEDCHIGLSEVAALYGQWLFCTNPFDAGLNTWGECDAVWNLVEE